MGRMSIDPDVAVGAATTPEPDGAWEEHGRDQFAPSVARLLRMTARRNGCGTGTVRARVGQAVRTTWRPPCALAQVTFPRVGHAWPPGAATRLWRFVRRYRR